ncbi:hypothetical protein M432DRAFT_315163 [Thermoascus aurantiacus ATCC 26904]
MSQLVAYIDRALRDITSSARQKKWTTQGPMDHTYTYPAQRRRRRTVPHHPWLDLLPVPRMRDNLLLAGDSFDDTRLCHDLGGYQSVRTGRTGVIVWGDPWDPNGLEVTDAFVTAWGWVIQDCWDLFEKWRAQRGEKPLFRVP